MFIKLLWAGGFKSALQVMESCVLLVTNSYTLSLDVIPAGGWGVLLAAGGG